MRETSICRKKRKKMGNRKSIGRARWARWVINILLVGIIVCTFRILSHAVRLIKYFLLLWFCSFHDGNYILHNFFLKLFSKIRTEFSSVNLSNNNYSNNNKMKRNREKGHKTTSRISSK